MTEAHEAAVSTSPLSAMLRIARLVVVILRSPERRTLACSGGRPPGSFWNSPDAPAPRLVGGAALLCLPYL